MTWPKHQPQLSWSWILHLWGLGIPSLEDGTVRYDISCPQTRQIDRTDGKAVKEANMYFLTESTIALFVSFLINLFVMAVFAEAFYHQTNQEVVSAMPIHLSGEVDPPQSQMDSPSSSSSAVQHFFFCNEGRNGGLERRK